MFICGPKFVIMSPQFKRWLKEPTDWKIYSLAKECNIIVKREYFYGCEGRHFYSFYRPDGTQIRTGKTERSRSVFGLYDGYKILKKEQKNVQLSSQNSK